MPDVSHAIFSWEKIGILSNVSVYFLESGAPTRTRTADLLITNTQVSGITDEYQTLKHLD
jgi:hypothetical protein